MAAVGSIPETGTADEFTPEEIAQLINAEFAEIYGRLNPNLLINPEFAINQREAASYTLTGYAMDRWRIRPGGASSMTASQGAGITDDAEFSLLWERDLAGGASDIVEQRIEDVRRFGGKRLAVSFDLISDAGGDVECGLDFNQHFGSGGSADVSTTDIIVTATTTAQRKVHVVDIPSVSLKTIGANNYLALRFFRGTGQTNGDIRIGNVDVRLIPDGFTPTDGFYHPPDQRLELLRARRYFERIGFNQAGVKYVSTGYASTTSQMVAVVPFQEKRIAPTISSSAAAGFALLHAPVVGQTATSLSFANTDPASTRVTMNVSGTPLTVGEAVLFRVNSTSAFIDIDAEL